MLLPASQGRLTRVGEPWTACSSPARIQWDMWLFPLSSQQTLGCSAQNLRAEGRGVGSDWEQPSESYIAAAHWIEVGMQGAWPGSIRFHGWALVPTHPSWEAGKL